MRILVALLFALFFVLDNIQAQDPNNLAIDATVKDREGGKLQDATVKLIQDGAEINSVTTGKNGRFDLFLDFGHEYLIEIKKQGYISKKLYVNTYNVPEDEQAWGYEFGGFIIDLFKDVAGIDYSILKKPVGKVYYDENISNFQYDREYTKEIQKEVTQLEKEYEAKKDLQNQLENQKEEDYLLAIRDAQNAINDGDLLNAKENLLAAQGIKPNSQEVKSKLEQVNNQLLQQKNNQVRFENLINQGDQFLKNSKFDDALKAYAEAKIIKENDQVIAKKISDTKIAQQKAIEAARISEANKLLETQYNELIAKADAAFNQKNYLDAKTLYQSAIDLNGTDNYPKEQIKLADARLQSIAEQEKLEKEQQKKFEQYTATISNANAFFNQGDFIKAQALYKDALALMPNEALPQQRLNEINIKLSQLEQLKANKKEFEQKLALGKSLTDKKDYQAALSAYKDALSLNPESNIPAQQIDLIQSLINEEAKLASAAKKIEAQNELYAATIEQANQLFSKKSWDEAKIKYEQAIAMKSNDSFPREQIQKINQEKEAELKANIKIAEADNIKRRSEDWILKGDEAFSNKQISIAIKAYTEALNLVPNQSHAMSQLEILSRMISEEQAKSKLDKEQVSNSNEIAKLLAAANDLFSANNFEQAKNKYEEVLKKENNEIAINRIKVINEKLAEISKQANEKRLKDQQLAAYNAKLVEAEQLYSNKKLEEALKAYNEAYALNKNESYPKEKAEEIKAILSDRAAADQEAQRKKSELAKQATINQEYQQIIQEADKFRDSQDYDFAVKKYNLAQAIKPDESYPRLQIEAIKKLQSELTTKIKAEEEKKLAFENYLKKGDEALQSQKWEEAKSAYNKALTLKPQDAYAASQLKEISRLKDLQEETAKKSTYEKYISEADKFFLNKQYQSAKDNYQEALTLYADASYPKERLSTIAKLISEMDKDEIEEKVDVERKIIEEKYDEGNTKVTIRRVIIGANEDVYKMVIYSWGGKYYFLNDKPISEFIWIKETSK